jgi:hypothetical protein
MLSPARFLTGLPRKTFLSLHNARCSVRWSLGTRLAKGIALPIAINLSVDLMMKLDRRAGAARQE